MGGAGWRWWRRPSGAVRGCAALEDLHVRLAAVDQDAGQLAGEATHDLVEALLWSLAAELRGSGLATPPRSPWTWWPTCRPHRRAPGLRPVDAHRHAGRTALAAGRRDLALEVFAAANRPRPSAGLPGRAIPGAHRPAAGAGPLVLQHDLIKSYVRLPDLMQKRAIEGAHRLGIPTSSHEIYPAALSGSDSVEHVGSTSRHSSRVTRGLRQNSVQRLSCARPVAFHRRR